jgi:hypothetical protein
MNGKGKLIFPDHSKYEGDLLDNKRTGYGEFYWPDGRIYKGEFKDGYQHGVGDFTDPSSSMIRRGNIMSLIENKLNRLMGKW